MKTKIAQFLCWWISNLIVYSCIRAPDIQCNHLALLFKLSLPTFKFLVVSIGSFWFFLSSFSSAGVYSDYTSSLYISHCFITKIERKIIDVYISKDKWHNLYLWIKYTWNLPNGDYFSFVQFNLLFFFINTFNLKLHFNLFHFHSVIEVYFDT